ncbi:DUF2083 domain-containing protein [Lentibacter algarum]|uniref:helix-turn-helix transcriptional regulator n=1 Tax=Lentibacter algarum TaxID=576131 RepID=UPI001C06902F|nr:helix-turn-helix transcriptional regulator [Lentibacter algarum]MBU2982124.1 DUF2083 domain-containing protein [Lentibacter algarum]
MRGHASAGTRIRERRIAKGLRQATLAAEIGISASYLNLIEHNRRRIGGKLLQALAQRLEVESSLLSEGAEQAVVARLSSVAERFGEEGGAADATEFATRFPAWANLVIRAARRVDDLERSVETLTDRLTHDPHLAATLHEVLSTVTSIRATASILQDTKEIEPEWRDRFHRNINEDAARLTDGAEALVGFLDGVDDAQSEVSSPQEEFTNFLSAYGWHFPAIEAQRSGAADSYLKGAPQLSSSSAQAIAERYLACYEDDARKMPLVQFQQAMQVQGGDPLKLAQEFSVDTAGVLRRIATLPDSTAGLIVCDASGTLVLRKPVEGFPVPRFGASCPLWPLFQALSRPMTTLSAQLNLPTRSGVGDSHFHTYATAQPVLSLGYGREPLLEATMLILPQDGPDTSEPAFPVGPSCRVCPRDACAARREPSIMTSGF